MNELKTEAIVLRRTNYGEADRILQLLTPEGKVGVMARGVRKSRSKLAGGVEMMTLSQVEVRQGKGELGVLTGAKMQRFYGGILKDLGRIELVTEVLRRVSAAAEGGDSPEYFAMVKEILEALDTGVGVRVAQVWFELNLAKVMGEEVNLYRDALGVALSEEVCYNWDSHELALRAVSGGAIEEAGGDAGASGSTRASGDAKASRGAGVSGAAGKFGTIGVNEIKLMRLMQGVGLGLVRRVTGVEEMCERILAAGVVRSE